MMANTRIYNLSCGLHITRFSAVVAKRTESFRVSLYFENSEHSVQIADDYSKVTSKALQLTLVLYILKLALYFNSIIFSNQIKYYLAVNRRNFLQIQYGFYRHTLQIRLQL